jgi:hypothetical protein
MPGYASQPDLSKTILTQEPDEVDEFYDNIFYGLRYNAQDGTAYFERIGSDEVVRLPEEGIVRDDDYVHFFTSPKKLRFVWDENDNSRLLLEVT